MQPLKDIEVHPTDMSNFGTTPFGPRYRIVRASSRIDKMEFQGRIHTFPRYADQGDKWILEKHLPVDKLLGMNREAFEALLAGPMHGQARPEYPADGDYEYVYHWDGPVDPITAYKIAAMIDFDQENATDAERSAAVYEAAAMEEEAKEQRLTESIKEVMENA